MHCFLRSEGAHSTLPLSFVGPIGVVLVVDFGVCASVFVGIRSISHPKVTGLVVGFEVWVKRCRMHCCLWSESAYSTHPLCFCLVHRCGVGGRFWRVHVSFRGNTVDFSPKGTLFCCWV